VNRPKLRFSSVGMILRNPLTTSTCSVVVVVVVVFIVVDLLLIVVLLKYVSLLKTGFIVTVLLIFAIKKIY
jgi:hypothetical protein